MLRFDVMTLFPEMVAAPLSESIIGRAQKAEKLCVVCHNIRDYSKTATAAWTTRPTAAEWGC